MKNAELMADADDEQDSKLANILLVDDDAALTRGLKRYLCEDFHVHTAICPAEANVIVSKVDVDLIVSDNLMTGVLGTEFLDGIHKSYPHIKLLMLSGYMPQAAAKRVVAESGVEQVLTKPCPSSVVVAAIRKALGLQAD